MKDKQKKIKIIILICFIAIISISCVFYKSINPWFENLLQNSFNVVNSQNSLMVHYVSVGQADAAVINLPDGKVAVVDTGLEKSSSTLVEYIRNKVLNNSKDDDIDYLFLSHSDSDHIGGALNILKNFDVKTIYMPTVGSESSTYKNLTDYISENNYNTITNADGTMIGTDYTIKFYGPFLEFEDTNDSSPIIKLTYNEVDFLFTGDMGAEAELKAVEKYGNELDCEILKVAHHGSKYSTCDEFLNIATPDYSVISCGYNTYGHPTDEVLNKLTNIGSEIYRTDNDGNILIKVENEDLSIIIGSYTVTSLPIDYKIFVIVIDVVLLVNLIIVIVKEPKKVKAKRKNK